VPNPESRQLQEALDGRLPVLPRERIYKTYGSLLWTTAVLSTASWAYLIGSALPAFGNTRLTIVGYVIGLLIGEVAVIFAIGIPCYRYGADAVDVAKASLGSRGSAFLLIMVLGTCIASAYILIAMTARGIARLASTAATPPTPISETLVVVTALALLPLLWYLTKRGPAAMERLSKFFASGLIALALLILGLLVMKYGASGLGRHGVPPELVVTKDPLAQITYGVEFGFDNALTLMPFLGSLTRLVRHKRHLVGPTLIGSALVSASVLSTVAAFGGDAFADADPTSWIIKLAGPVWGSAIVAFVLIGNVGTLVVLFYIASVALQQARAVAALRWEWVIALTLLPGIPFAFYTEWLLTRVMTLIAYNGMIFIGLAAVQIADFYFLRRQRLQMAHLFARPHQGLYWYWGGVNWVAMAVIAEAAGVYLALFDPVSYRTDGYFRYIGAGIPALITACVTYYGVMRFLIARGAVPTPWTATSQRAATLEVGL
jgi:NCS1 family nucleobase:cation symporter-1